jgi:hypothetical protein
MGRKRIVRVHTVTKHAVRQAAKYIRQHSTPESLAEWDTSKPGSRAAPNKNWIAAIHAAQWPTAYHYTDGIRELYVPTNWLRQLAERVHTSWQHACRFMLKEEKLGEPVAEMEK